MHFQELVYRVFAPILEERIRTIDYPCICSAGLRRCTLNGMAFDWNVKDTIERAVHRALLAFMAAQGEADYSNPGLKCNGGAWRPQRQPNDDPGPSWEELCKHLNGIAYRCPISRVPFTRATRR